MKDGILIGNDYKIESFDKLNVVVKKFVPYSEVKQKDGSIKPVEEHWNSISYHANVKQAIKSIFDRETNLTVSDGIQTLIDKIDKFESIINNL